MSAADKISRPNNILNLLLDILSNQSRYINNIIKELERWETIPNCREPISQEIIEYIIVRGKCL